LSGPPRNSAIPRVQRLLQAADRRVGGWLVRHARPRARALTKRAEPGVALASGEVCRLLVIRPGGLGDALLMWPMLDALRAAFPTAELDLLCERRNAGAFALGEPPGTVLRYDQDLPHVVRHLVSRRYDLVIDTEQYHHMSTVVANALGPRWLCGFDTLGRQRLQTHAVSHAEDTYEAVSFLRLAAAVTGQAAAFDPDRPFLRVAREALDWADMALRAAGDRPVVAIMPAAGGSYRLWPAERYAELAQWLIRRGFFVALLGGHDGRQAAELLAARSGAAQLVDLVGSTTLAQTAAVLSRARLAVSADTGVLHLAYGVGTPTVGLFGPGLYRKWAPPGRVHRIVRLGLPCSPCIRFGVLPQCPYGIACMRDITVADVQTAIESLTT
jgi:ADP-heptose:LPS heptosyltransferase